MNAPSDSHSMPANARQPSSILVEMGLASFLRVKPRLWESQEIWMEKVGQNSQYKEDSQSSATDKDRKGYKAS
jgi:hypothetical protein